MESVRGTADSKFGELEIILSLSPASPTRPCSPHKSATTAPATTAITCPHTFRFPAFGVTTAAPVGVVVVPVPVGAGVVGGAEVLDSEPEGVTAAEELPDGLVAASAVTVVSLVDAPPGGVQQGRYWGVVMGSSVPLYWGHPGTSVRGGARPPPQSRPPQSSPLLGSK